MNDRIQQMYKRAHAHAWDMACKSRHGPGDVSDRQMWEWETDKLVELVINECAGVYEAIDNGNQVKGTNNYLKALQLRFGVK